VPDNDPSRRGSAALFDACAAKRTGGIHLGRVMLNEY